MMKKATRQTGYTLIELLVVLVITALTTALMVTGLGTTWRNFEKLSSRDLTVKTARLPLMWFTDSFEGALLYHPDTIMFSGSSDSMRFTTFRAPDAQNAVPQEIDWFIRQGNLVFQSANSEGALSVFPIGDGARFEYLSDAGWQSSFSEQAGKLPAAVRIIRQSETLALALPGRPPIADLPPELPAFGQYEF